MSGHGPQLNSLLAMGWTYVGPTRIQDGRDVWWEIRVKELPDFFVAGEDREGALRELRPALEAFLSSYLEAGDEVPIPALRWLFIGYDTVAKVDDKAPTKVRAPIVTEGDKTVDSAAGVLELTPA